jgi:hypothetical protein
VYAYELLQESQPLGLPGIRLDNFCLQLRVLDCFEYCLPSSSVGVALEDRRWGTGDRGGCEGVNVVFSRTFSSMRLNISTTEWADVIKGVRNLKL